MEAKVAVWNHGISFETFVVAVWESEFYIRFSLGSIWDAQTFASAEAERIARRLTAQYKVRGERCRAYTL